MVPMTGVSGRTDRRRGGSGLPSAVVRALVLAAVFLCCSPAGTASLSAGPPSVTALRAFTPAPATAVAVVVADAPDERGIGSSCHGTTDHTTAVVLSGHPAPVALPCSSAAHRAAPLTGAAAVRGPANDSVGAVDRLRLQVQRI
ncbi:hypothetical protein [Streptomyces sp. NPDC014623]|uniref:hypothetical protein n=1 Tax=Streptomyces sp. NPDC014623 TaxID=3364875 RepID=UPI0036FF8C8E